MIYYLQDGIHIFGAEPGKEPGHCGTTMPKRGRRPNFDKSKVVKMSAEKAEEYIKTKEDKTDEEDVLAKYQDVIYGDIFGNISPDYQALAKKAETMWGKEYYDLMKDQKYFNSEWYKKKKARWKVVDARPDFGSGPEIAYGEYYNGNILIATNFLYSVSKKSFDENNQTNYLEKCASLCNCKVIKLPKKGIGALSIFKETGKIVDYETNNDKLTKSIDRVIKNPFGIQAFFTFKMMSDKGGSQDTQFQEGKDFVKFGRKANNYVVSLLDFYKDAKKKYTSNLNAMSSQWDDKNPEKCCILSSEEISSWLKWFSKQR